ncbi:MAG: efflux RND transporter periplasmic adaptor subunit, partial [Tepidisphaeraceae bacterium]
KALSHTEQFDKKQDLAVSIVAAMEECVDQAEIVQFEPDGAGTENVTRAAQELSRKQGGVGVLSLPLRRRGDAVGVITLEFNPQKKISEQAARGMSVAVELLAPQLFDRYQNDRYLVTKAGLSTRWLGEQIFRSPKHMLAKVLAIIVIGGLLFITLFHKTYYVDAPFQFTAVEERVISAPFEGYIGEIVNVRPGDKVKAGQVLMEMRTDELVTKRYGAQSTAAAKLAEARKYAADPSKTADYKQALKESEAAQAEADLYQKQIDQAIVKAPLDGEVLSGDWFDKRGAAVRKGEPLFRVAQRDRFYGELEVAERDIQWVKLGQSGYLHTSSLPQEWFGFKVDRIVPLGDAKEASNVFKVYVVPEKISGQWRPGMQGTAQIAIEKRSLGWIWTHRLVDYVRLKLWI